MNSIQSQSHKVGNWNYELVLVPNTGRTWFCGNSSLVGKFLRARPFRYGILKKIRHLSLFRPSSPTRVLPKGEISKDDNMRRKGVAT